MDRRPPGPGAGRPRRPGGRLRRPRLLLVLLLLVGCGEEDGPGGEAERKDREEGPPGGPAGTEGTEGTPAPPPGAPGDGRERTHMEMRNVDLRLGEGIVFHVEYLAADMIAMEPGRPVVLDDKHVYVLHIDTAYTAVSFEGLSNLLNDHVFAYDGAPLRNLAVTREVDPGEEGRIEIRGNLVALAGVPFEMEGVPELTPAGEMRVRARSIQVVDIAVGGLLDLLGAKTEDLIDARRARGIRIEGDDLVLSPERMLPPPETRGRVVALGLRPDSLVLIFGGTAGGAAEGSRDAGTAATDAGARKGEETSQNYLQYRGGLTRIGRLTMTDTDIRVVDADPDDPFGFDIDRMHQQLNAGYVKLRADGGLTPFAVDYQDLPPDGKR